MKTLFALLRTSNNILLGMPPIPLHFAECARLVYLVQYSGTPW